MSEKKLKPIQFIPFYLLWGVSGLVCVLDWLVSRAAVTAVASAIAASIPKEVQIERQWFLRWPVAALDKFALVILGIVAMLVVMALDYVYRDGLIKGTIKKRFATVTAIQVGILLLSALAIGISSRVV
jgi:hypothetical protein